MSRVLIEVDQTIADVIMAERFTMYCDNTTFTIIRPTELQFYGVKVKG